MQKSMQSRADHCYALAENGATELANTALKLAVGKLYEFTEATLGRAQALESMERAARRIGVDVALGYAGHFYHEKGYRAAREWLRYARFNAKCLNLDISGRISAMKGKYKDRMPLFW